MSSEPLTKKRLVTLVAGLFILTLLTWHRLGQEPEVYEWKIGRGTTMGTTYEVKFLGTEEISHELFLAIDQALETVEQSMSTYRPGSELSRFNQSGTEPIELSPELYQVFKTALTVNVESDGAFDITVGPIVNAYGFGPTPVEAPPTDEALKLLRTSVGAEHLSLEASTMTLQKDLPEVYCDLSAIAKGYGVDVLAQIMESYDIDDYYVEIGGEVRCHGVNPDGNPWRLGIEKPIEGQREIYQVVSLNNQAMATSGGYRNYIVVDGKQLSHTIDPRTGRPVDHALVSATVLHSSCERADAYATALMVLGEEEGLAFAEEHGLLVFLIVREADGSLRDVASSAWESQQ